MCIAKWIKYDPIERTVLCLLLMWWTTLGTGIKPLKEVHPRQQKSRHFLRRSELREWHVAAFAALHHLGRDWSKADKRALTDLD